jgi:DNA-binding SARP family transcriptional activator
MTQGTATKSAPVTKRPEEAAPVKKAFEQIVEAEPAFEQIQQRAYEIYLARGDQPGSDLDDWLQAERELRAKF